MKYVVVGAGLWGCTMANLISTELEKPVLLIDKRDHIGGNCYSEIHDSTGIEYHKYGSHIFHTSLPHVWKYLNQFTEFTTYRHFAFTEHEGKVYNFPVNLKTINDFYGFNLKPWEVSDFIKQERTKYFTQEIEPRNLEEMAVSLIGTPLYEAFVKGYTQKQWQTDPKQLPAEIIKRLPIRSNYDSSYFTDPYQGIPKDGYSSMFQKMVGEDKRITIQLGQDWSNLKHTLQEPCTILYSGPIDEYFEYELGRLQYRTLDFQLETKDVGDFQGCAILNYADVVVPYTRVHEFKHLHPERSDILEMSKTLVCYEYSKFGAETGEDLLFYPINTPKNQAVYAKYRTKADTIATANKNLVIAGRLGSYRYLDMDRVVDDAISCFKRIKGTA